MFSYRFAAAAVLLPLSIILVGCGGGDDGPSNSNASLAVEPLRYDFGLVTAGNLDQVESRQFVLRNTGTAPYSVSNIRLAGVNHNDFGLDEGGVDTACNTPPLSLAPGASCTVAVGFAPPEQGFGSFEASLLVESQDARTVARTLSGAYAEIQAINVAVSQVDACPRDPATAFVSVTDEAGFPIRNLLLDNFWLAESTGGGRATERQPKDATTVGLSSAYPALALSILMDYSGSILEAPSDRDRENMEKAAAKIVSRMQSGDGAEIVKYAVGEEVAQAFTSDTAALLEAIAREPDTDTIGSFDGTALYDAVISAAERIQDQTLPRRAVIALTDGINNAGEEVEAAIDAANSNGVPVFTIGFGDVNSVDLQALADNTGGVFYEPPASDNLQDVYQRLANVLFRDQYVLTYGSDIGEDTEGELKVIVRLTDGSQLEGEATRSKAECPLR